MFLFSVLERFDRRQTELVVLKILAETKNHTTFVSVIRIFVSFE